MLPHASDSDVTPACAKHALQQAGNEDEGAGADDTGDAGVLAGAGAVETGATEEAGADHGPEVDPPYAGGAWAVTAVARPATIATLLNNCIVCIFRVKRAECRL